MDVILLERIGKLGHMGDVVTVKDGFARNFLLPTGKALRANATNRAKYEAQRVDLEKRNDERKTEATAISTKLDGISFIMVRQAGETGQLYGSVSARDIADQLVVEGYKVARNMVDLNLPIKTIGLKDVSIALHPDVVVTVTVNIARTTDEAVRQAGGEDLTTLEAIYGEDIGDASNPDDVGGAMEDGDYDGDDNDGDDNESDDA